MNHPYECCVPAFLPLMKGEGRRGLKRQPSPTPPFIREGCSIISLLLAVLLFYGCGSAPAPKSEEEIPQPSQTTRVQSEPVTLEVSGTIQSAELAQLAPRSSSYVREVAVVSGQKVKKGDLLILMDDQNLSAQEGKLQAGRAELESALDEAKHGLDAAQAQQQFAVNTFERIRSLYEKEAASKQEFEEAESRSKAAQAAYQAAKAKVSEVQAKQAQLKSDQSDLNATANYIRIVAPFEGIITEVPAKAGTFFNAGQIVVSMENPSRYQLVIAVEEGLLKSLQKDQMVGIRVSSLNDNIVNGKVAEISPAMDVYTRTFQVKINVAPMASLHSGVSAVALIRSSGRTLWVPAQYIRINQDVETVLVRSGNTWHRVLVKTGRQKEDKVEVLSGLNVDDEIGV